jgi:hypothetical protein
MPKRSDTIYDTYEFSEEEIPNAFIFNELQYKHIQTELAIAAQEKALLAYDPDSPNADDKFIRESEYIRGKMEAYLYLLATHDTTREQLIIELQQQAANHPANKPKIEGE